MSNPAPQRRLDRKLISMLEGRYTPDDFVIADAKDADMAFGVAAPGPIPGAPGGAVGPGRYRTRAADLDAMRALVQQGELDAGCVAAAPGGRIWRQGSVRMPREHVRSTIGAGDAFAAGVILGLHEDWPVAECLRLGVASAAACVRSTYTSDGIERADACLAEADRLGYRATT